MLNWLSILFGRRHRDASHSDAGSAVLVEVDDKAITVDDGAGHVTRLAWADLASVTVATTDSGPFETDLFWLLEGGDGRTTLTVPMDAAGERALLLAMQARLAGFDNMAVVEAMSSTSHGVFQVWPAGELV